MIFHARSNWSRVERLRELLEGTVVPPRRPEDATQEDAARDSARSRRTAGDGAVPADPDGAGDGKRHPG